ncbi:MAG TPA: FecR family protein [Gammaproteobacteria bacterium]|nr:FecR family protein [Gammaproteobacteria bacterium]
MRNLTMNFALLSGFAACSFFSTPVCAAAAQVTYAYGQAQAINTAGQGRPLAKGAEVQSGDTVQTQQGRAQITFKDGGFVALQPNTSFKISEYNYAGKEDGSERSFFDLLKGSMRFVTGAIGHKNKQNYKIKTVVATIGIRGSGGLAILCVAGSCPGMKDGLYLTGNQDTLTLTNDGDSKDVHPGETYYVGCSNCNIEPVEETPVAHVDVPEPKGFRADEQCDQGCVLGNFSGNDRIVGVVPGGSQSMGEVVSALHGVALGTPPNFLLIKDSFSGNNTEALFFDGKVTDFSTFADDAFIFRWTNGTVTKFDANGTIVGTEVVGPDSGYSFIVGSGPRDPLPTSGIATYTFIPGLNGTASTNAMGTGTGIVGGIVQVDFFGPAAVDVSFEVEHMRSFYDVTTFGPGGAPIPLDTTNGTFSSFKGGAVFAYSYGVGTGSCYNAGGCPTDIVGSLEGPNMATSGSPIPFVSLGPSPSSTINAPEALGLAYRIHDNFGSTLNPQNWVKGVGAFQLCTGRCFISD